MDYDGRFIHKNNPHFNRQSSECRTELVRALPSREGGRPKANRMNQRSTAEGKVKFQFEFQNGEVLRLKLYEHLKMM